MILLFRIIAFIEGVSYILLMTVGLYFKYQLDDPSFVKLLGMPHGLLFVLYIITAFLLNGFNITLGKGKFSLSSRKYMKWTIIDFRIVLFASVIPFGTFYIDRKYFSNL